MTTTVHELATTAVKGFGLCHPASIRIEESGAVGDRDLFLVDDTDKLWSVTGHGELLGHWTRFDPDGEVLTLGRGGETLLEERVDRGEPVHAHLWGSRYQGGHLVPGPWSEAISRLAGDRVRLVRADRPSGGLDVEPVTMVSRASAAALGQELDGAPLDARRFRMLLTLDGPDAFAEDGWSGQEVEVGDALLRVGGEVPRCAAIQRRPGDGARGVNALRMIAQTRGKRPSGDGQSLNLGVYATVLRPGEVRVGDPVTVRPVTAR